MARPLTLLALIFFVAGAEAQDIPAVDIVRVTPHRWRATWRLPAPVTALIFDRPAAFFRERVWTVTTPGYRLARVGEREALVLDTGATAQRELSVDFGEYAETLPKEYELFQVFGDGAVALYTGHFDARPVGPAYPDSTWIRTVRIEPPPGTHAVLRGQVLPGPATFSDSAGDGTYVYLGGATPIETPDMLAIVDAGMPAWLSEMFEDHLPGIFATYRTRLGAALPWKPTVLYSFRDTAVAGYSSGGGTLTGLINMTLTGSAWRTPNAAATERAFHLIAHEASHLWNGQLARTDGAAGGAWMHEGSADAMADALLRSEGIVDSARARARETEAINLCAAAVAAGPVRTAIDRGAIRAVYDCGFVMAIWTGAAVRAVHPDEGLFGFWRRLLHAAQAHGGSYDEARYFAVLREAGVGDTVIRQMQSFLTATDSMDLAIRGLRAAGIPVHEGTGAPPLALQRQFARSALVHLMRQACHGRVDFNWGVPVRTGAVPGCTPFAGAMEVYRLDGFALGDEGAAAYDALVAACASGGSVTLQDEARQPLTDVPCTQPLAPRRPWYVLDRPIDVY